VLIISFVFFFFFRLQHFCKEQKLEICGEKASFGGTCLTQLHIDELWRVHDEVHIHYHACVFIDSVYNVDLSLVGN